MKRYCLDTSGYSNFKRARPEAVRAISEADWIGVPTIVIGELWAGFLLGSRPADNQKELLAFLDDPTVWEIPVDRDVARRYAELVAALRRSGTPLPTNDVWIAAMAGILGAAVLTYDEHFLAMDGVDVRLLP